MLNKYKNWLIKGFEFGQKMGIKSAFFIMDNINIIQLYGNIVFDFFAVFFILSIIFLTQLGIIRFLLSVHIIVVLGYAMANRIKTIKNNDY